MIRNGPIGEKFCYPGTYTQ